MNKMSEELKEKLILFGVAIILIIGFLYLQDYMSVSSIKARERTREYKAMFGSMSDEDKYRFLR